MLEFRSFLKRPNQEVCDLLGVDRSKVDDTFFLRHADVCFIPVESDEARRLITPAAKFFNGAVTLHDGEDVLVNFDCAEHEIWRIFINAILDYQQNGTARVEFAHGRWEMEWKPIGNDRLLFSLRHPKKEPVVKEVARKEFFNAVLEGLATFFQKVIEYGNQVERNRRTLEFLQSIELN